MNNIEQILSRCDLQKEDDESLASIRMHSEGAYEGIMSGLGAIAQYSHEPRRGFPWVQKWQATC
ncbi:hypothetical protein B1R47_00865 [Salmonella enterica subsp. enterica serovar Weltevreden]|uniref:hypothetical protein n=1 Tax=Salmonella enterica TaxID=28901 RepID=UPI00092E7A65|nr:hypothetical protein [Salmonella enterica]EBA3863892.1 hypothetical protein [Salmonella enterica]EBE7345474.1 hypothetical protein [Salmonella enterica]EBH2892605.1 hypothetical protein [Salmonella enterica subsp. enterica serovar Weltevreden]ECD1235377.1 hypothetical protein [Salmonella enterica subsp. enterica serovar Weltevreden]ECJ3500761.1 hypothetical protein [Salmonella enterica]